jgi:hypothetical protein
MYAKVFRDLYLGHFDDDILKLRQDAKTLEFGIEKEAHDDLIFTLVAPSLDYFSHKGIEYKNF